MSGPRPLRSTIPSAGSNVSKPENDTSKLRNRVCRRKRSTVRLLSSSTLYCHRLTNTFSLRGCPRLPECPGAPEPKLASIRENNWWFGLAYLTITHTEHLGSGRLATMIIHRGPAHKLHKLYKFGSTAAAQATQHPGKLSSRPLGWMEASGTPHTKKPFSNHKP